ncbi:MAG TPA: deoxyribonuclease IV [Candidatus Jorgensenbacteria bacterium]|nr:deoxyribonuclease IV [Candidatus Jorgensenbacteria bacterium]
MSDTIHNMLSMRNIGAHASITGGYITALKHITRIGGSCLQMFSTSPRSWRLAEISDDEVEEFTTLRQDLAIDPVYFHASYLINLADDGRIGNASKRSLVHELHIAERLGVRGSVVHLGSFKDKHDIPIQEYSRYDVLLANIREVLEKTPKTTMLIIENAGVRKIGKNLEEFEALMGDLANDRVRVCLDTCHLHATGYRIDTKKNLDVFLKLFDERIGLDKLELWHANDSRDPFESFRDRHDNIGEGEIGLETFRYLLNDARVSALPFVIETPGFDGMGPDKKNVDILKALAT